RSDTTMGDSIMKISKRRARISHEIFPLMAARSTARTTPRIVPRTTPQALGRATARISSLAAALIVAGTGALTLGTAWITPAFAQSPPGGFPSVLGALKATPGCLGVETGQTSGGRRVIFAWFENKKALVGWYHSEAHQKAMKSVFPNQTFDRQPLP